jgi:hypothetical protein
MMDQFDGSYHEWLENGEKWCLLCAVDDATSKLCMQNFQKGNDLRIFWNL